MDDASEILTSICKPYEHLVDALHRIIHCRSFVFCSSDMTFGMPIRLGTVRRVLSSRLSAHTPVHPLFNTAALDTLTC